MGLICVGACFAAHAYLGQQRCRTHKKFRSERRFGSASVWTAFLNGARPVRQVDAMP